MAIYIGSKKVKDIYYGNRKVAKIYKGSNLIYKSTPETSTSTFSVNANNATTQTVVTEPEATATQDSQ